MNRIMLPPSRLLDANTSPLCCCCLVRRSVDPPKSCFGTMPRRKKSEIYGVCAFWAYHLYRHHATLCRVCVCLSSLCEIGPFFHNNSAPKDITHLGFRQQATFRQCFGQVLGKNDVTVTHSPSPEERKQHTGREIQ
jgi:hypothetical protein